MECKAAAESASGLRALPHSVATISHRRPSTPAKSSQQQHRGRSVQQAANCSGKPLRAVAACRVAAALQTCLRIAAYNGRLVQILPQRQLQLLRSSAANSLGEALACSNSLQGRTADLSAKDGVAAQLSCARSCRRVCESCGKAANSSGKPSLATAAVRFSRLVCRQCRMILCTILLSSFNSLERVQIIC